MSADSKLKYNDPEPCDRCRPSYDAWTGHADTLPALSIERARARSHAAHIRALCRVNCQRLPYIQPILCIRVDDAGRQLDPAPVPCTRETAPGSLFCAHHIAEDAIRQTNEAEDAARRDLGALLAKGEHPLLGTEEAREAYVRARTSRYREVPAPIAAAQSPRQPGGHPTAHLAPADRVPVLIESPDGTAGTVLAGDLRALGQYLDRRDGHDLPPLPPKWSAPGAPKTPLPLDHPATAELSPLPVSVTVNVAGGEGRSGVVHRAAEIDPASSSFTPICPNGARAARRQSVAYELTDRIVSCGACLDILDGSR